MRKLIIGLIILLISIWIGLLIHRDPGYVLISYQHWSLETSVWFALAFLIVLFIAIYLLIRFFKHTRGLGQRIGNWQQARQLRKALSQTNLGLCELAEGNWHKAEQLLTKSAGNSNSPLINYLAAARAAQNLGAYQRRDDYLQKAHASTKGSEAAVGLTQAQLQVDAAQWDQALTTLKNLNKLVPNHSYTLKLLARVYVELKDWQQLESLLPTLKKYRVFEDQQFLQLEEQTYSAILEKATPNGEDNIQNMWNALPKSYKQQPTLVRIYAEKLIHNGMSEEAISLISNTLKKNWDTRLVTLFAQAHGDDPHYQLEIAQNWLKRFPDDAELYLTLGRLALRAQLWGKANEYLQKSLEFKPQALTYQCLGLLEEQQNNQAQALSYYRKGLDLSED